MYFKKSGIGKNLIILHGLYGSSDNWIPIIKILEKSFTVFAVDLRNHGKSPHFNSHNYSDLTNDIFSFIKEHNIENPIILGHSMGGKAAMFFAKLYPEMISKLIIVDISPLPYAYTNSISAELIGHKKIINALLAVDLSIVNNFTDIKNQLKRQISDERTILFLLKNIDKQDNNSFKWRLNLEVISKDLYKILDGFDVDEEIQINIPTLFIKGENSNYISEKHIDYIKKTFKKSRISIVKNSGHWVHAEQKSQFILQVEDFLNE